MKGIQPGRRQFKPTPGDPVAIDPHEQAALERAGDEMLAALAREHPERVTPVQHGHGTKSPRRMPMPVEGGLKTNFEP
jgi:hypothetical protein